MAQITEFRPTYTERKRSVRAMENEFARNLYYLVHTMRVLHLSFPESMEYKQLYFRLREIQDRITDFDEHYLKTLPTVVALMSQAQALGQKHIDLFNELVKECDYNWTHIFRQELQAA